jgi:hypothetical protein
LEDVLKKLAILSEKTEDSSSVIVRLEAIVPKEEAEAAI